LLGTLNTTSIKCISAVGENF